MSEKNYFAEKDSEGYFTNPSTPSVSPAPGQEASVATVTEPIPTQPDSIEEAHKAYTRSSHKLVIRRYAIKRT
jgi:hypothetical protein